MRRKMKALLHGKIGDVSARNRERAAARRARVLRHHVLRAIDNGQVLTIVDARALLKRLRARWVQSDAMGLTHVTLPAGPVLIFSQDGDQALYGYQRFG